MFEQLENQIVDMENLVKELSRRIGGLRGELEQARAEAAAASGPRCRTCNSPLEADALFCTVCGTRVDGAPKEAPAAVPVAPVAAPAAAAPAPAMSPEIPKEEETAVKEVSEPEIPEMPEADVPEAPVVETPEIEVPEVAEPEIPAAAEEAKPVMMSFCTNCGSKLEPGSIFCSECGAKLPV